MNRVFLLLFAIAAVPVFADGTVSFNRDIRPILSDTCYHCHGPDKNSRMANLRLDVRDEALKTTRSGITPIVPGKPEQSAIIERIFSTNAAKIMPPKYAHKELTAKQKELFRKWVAEGAEYESHWAYMAVRRPAGNIDSLIAARLAKEGLKMSAEADRRTLIRRVSLDLTGIPPTPGEVAAFVNDKSGDAYEKLVDRLLDSPRYAEKQAMHWLDAVRYADTCGFHGDNPFPAWPYRDYVLKAFRTNKPFDVFTREQIAGDLLAEGGVEQKVASAYNRMNRTSAEGGVQPKEYLAKYAADRVRTTATVWLGTTLGCAECHDHKFDPFPSRDFYSLKAFFADIKETGLVPDRGEKAWGSQLEIASEEQKAQRSALRDRIEALQASMKPAAVENLLQRYEAGEFSWKFQRPVAAKAEKGATLTVYNDDPVEYNYDFRGSSVTERKPGDGLVVASGANPDNENYTVTLKPGAGTFTALGLEVVIDETLPGVKIARGADRLTLTEVEVALDGKPVKLAMASDALVFPAADQPAMATIDGNPRTGWGLTIYGESRNPFLAVRFGERVTTTEKSTLTVRLKHESEYRKATLGRFRLALSTAEHSWPGIDRQGASELQNKQTGLPGEVVTALKAKDRTEAQNKAIEEYVAWATLPGAVELAKLKMELSLLEASIPRVVVTEATTPEPTRILARGNWMDDTGEVVEPAIPGAFGKLNVERRATRLDLANWLASKENPLTARVFANRVWRQFFGTGLSKALDDLGSQGESPVHPEVLDLLAAEFMEPSNGAPGWNVRHLIRTIVTSATYKQSSMTTPELEAKDPYNRLLARQSRFRVDAEIVRDTALAVSGLLVERFGGPSVRPYQPEGYLAALNFPKRDYSASRGEDLYRRGLYIRWQRTFLNPAMMTFDAPTREECTVNRVNSNTPLQALVLLNDPVFVEAARAFAQRILQEGGRKLEAQLDWAFQQAFSRNANAEERRILTDLHRKARSKFKKDGTGAREMVAVGEAALPGKMKAADLAAMMTVSRAILNLHETITRN